MGTNVYANNNEISSKAAKGKSSASFPDPCWSPPPPPTGPLVIPYPNTAKAKTLKKGTRTVVIKGTMVAKKDISYFAKSSGNEPATKVFQKGFLTRTIKGKAYYIVWSQNVKFEGKGVARHNDKMTHNHGSMMGNTPPNGYMDTSAEAVEKACKDQLSKIYNECEDESVTEKGDMPKNSNDWMKHCNGLNTKPSYPKSSNTDLIKKISDYNLAFDSNNKIASGLRALANREDHPSHKMTVIMSDLAKKNKCITARRCMLRTYKETKKDASKKGNGCCPGQTGHHLIPSTVGCQCNDSYEENDAPTICAEGVSNHHGTHGKLHSSLKNRTDKCRKPALAELKMLTYPQMRDMCSESAVETFPNAGCSKDCFNAQLDEFYSGLCGNKRIEPFSGTSGEEVQRNLNFEELAK